MEEKRESANSNALVWAEQIKAAELTIQRLKDEDENNNDKKIVLSNQIDEYKNEISIIDQHAAHERVNYEKLIYSTEKKIVSQELLNPIILNLSAEEDIWVQDNIEFFIVSTAISCPISSLKFFGLYFNAKTLCTSFSITSLGAARPETCS